MSTIEKPKPGVYRNGYGHTLVINKHQPDEIGVPPDYVYLGTEDEFAEGRFHPYALPGQEPDGWTPEGAGHNTFEPIVGEAASLDLGLSEEEVDAKVAASVKAALEEQAKTFQAELKKAVEAESKKAQAAADAKLKDAVTAAVEAATK